MTFEEQNPTTRSSTFCLDFFVDVKVPLASFLLMVISLQTWSISKESLMYPFHPCKQAEYGSTGLAVEAVQVKMCVR